MNPLSRSAVRRLSRALLTIEHLEDRLVPGRTLGPRLRWPACPVAAGTVPAQEGFDDRLPVSTDRLSLPADGDAVVVNVDVVRAIQDSEQRTITAAERDTAPDANELRLDL